MAFRLHSGYIELKIIFIQNENSILTSEFSLLLNGPLYREMFDVKRIVFIFNLTWLGEIKVSICAECNSFLIKHLQNFYVILLCFTDEPAGSLPGFSDTWLYLRRRRRMCSHWSEYILHHLHVSVALVEAKKCTEHP